MITEGGVVDRQMDGRVGGCGRGVAEGGEGWREVGCGEGEGGVRGQSWSQMLKVLIAIVA